MKPRPFLLRVAATGGLFLGGVPLGFVARNALAPGAPDVLAFVFFPLLFVFTVGAWRVAALGTAVTRLFRRKPLSKPGETVEAGANEVLHFPPGTWVLLPAALGGAVGGFVLGLWTDSPFTIGLGGAAFGAAYGAALWLIAKYRLFSLPD